MRYARARQRDLIREGYPRRFGRSRRQAARVSTARSPGATGAARAMGQLRPAAGLSTSSSPHTRPRPSETAPPPRRPEPSARGRARALTPCARTSRARTPRVPTPRTRHAPPKSSTPPRLFAPARKRGSLNLCRDPDVVATQDTVGPDILTVCSTPSRRVALLRPRVAGLTALTASPRPRHHDPSLDRRCSRRHPQMLWSTSCSEFRVLK